MAAARRMASQVNQAAGAELAGGGGHIGGYHG